MARRRMISHDIVRGDGFITLPHSAQALFQQLTIDTDDAGFVGAPMSALRIIGCTNAEMDALGKAGFIYRFEPSGAVLMRHWHVANKTPSDRAKATAFQAERDLVKLDANKVYAPLDTNWIQNGYILEVQDNVTQPNSTEPNQRKPNQGEPNTTEGKGTGGGTNTLPDLLTDAEYSELCSRFGGCVGVDKWLATYARLGRHGPFSDVMRFIESKGAA